MSDLSKELESAKAEIKKLKAEVETELKTLASKLKSFIPFQHHESIDNTISASTKQLSQPSLTLSPGPGPAPVEQPSAKPEEQPPANPPTT